MIQHTDTYSTVSPYKSSNHLLRYFMYHLTVLRFEAWSSSRRYTSPVTNFSEHLHVTLKYTHRPIHQLETCYAQRLTQFDVSATSGSNNLKPMFSLLSKFLQKTAVRFCTILCQLFIDIFWRRREGRKKHRTEVRKCPHGVKRVARSLCCPQILIPITDAHTDAQVFQHKLQDLSTSLHKTCNRPNLITVQQDATYSIYYISVGSSTCFGCWHPSPGARTAVIIASGID